MRYKLLAFSILHLNDGYKISYKNKYIKLKNQIDGCPKKQQYQLFIKDTLYCYQNWPLYIV